jgi:hypothetical protein
VSLSDEISLGVRDSGGDTHTRTEYGGTVRRSALPSQDVF